MSRYTFADVAGIDDAKDEPREIVDFLKTRIAIPQARRPHPSRRAADRPAGHGQDAARTCRCGRGRRPVFSLSASEFIEMIVGVGASRVRDLFAQAKAAAPAIIFIDELDAIGRSRSSGGGCSAAHDEREQTLNQILTEMDGFDGTTGVIVLGRRTAPSARRRAAAPGRFDRRVDRVAPDSVGRKKILEVHTRSMPLDGDVDLDDRRRDPGHGRRGPREPRQRGGADRRARGSRASSSPTSPRRWRRSSSAHRAQGRS